VAQVVYSGHAVENIERAIWFLREKDPEVANASAAVARSAVENLATHPLIGRRVEGDLRELVISARPATSRFIASTSSATRCACLPCATSARSAIYPEREGAVT
jgi:plasmid stabilization system protein ParE